MKREERKVLDLRKGYTIDEVEELRNGRLIKMSSIEYPSYKGRRKAKTRRTTTMALVFATAVVLAVQPGVQRGQSGGAEHR